MTEEHINTEVEQEEITQEDEQTKTYTEEEMQSMLQAEADKRVTSALDKAKAKWKKELEHERERAKQEASMTEEERFQSQLEEERKAFEAERAEFMQAKRHAQTMEQLSEEGLPAHFAKFLIGQDDEEIQENIKVFKEDWDKHLNKMVDERLSGRTPSVRETAIGDEGLSRSEFLNLPYEERIKMLEGDPDLLDKLN